MVFQGSRLRRTKSVGVGVRANVDLDSWLRLPCCDGLLGLSLFSKHIPTASSAGSSKGNVVRKLGEMESDG